MSKIEVKNAKKIGLISAISMLIGSTIGVGIFFKNNNVFETNNYNSIGILLAWIISGLISICTAFCFAEVGSSKQSESGLGGWYEMLVNKKSGKFIKIIQPLFYFMIIAFAICIFAAESIFNIFHFSEKINFSLIIILGIFIFILFLIFNLISINISAKFQIVISFLKFIPLLLVIFAGIIFGSIHNQYNLFNSNNIINQHSQNNINFISIIISIPSILFAFDSFIGVGNLSLEMRNPKKNVPLAIVIGMIIVTIFYILITIGQIMVGQGNIYDVFNIIFKNNFQAQNIMYIFLSICLVISIFGVLNAFSLIVLKSCQSLADENLIIFHHQYKQIAKKISNNKFNNIEGFIISLIFILFLTIITIIPSAILNTDSIIDGISNFPTTIFFSLYGIIILATLINRKTKKIPVQKIKFFIPMAIISISGCFFVTGFQVFYTFFIKTIISPFSILSWGLFSINGFITYNWIATLVLFLYLLIAILYFLINYFILNKQQKNNNKKMLNIAINIIENEELKMIGINNIDKMIKNINKNKVKNISSINKKITIRKEDYD